MVSSSTTSLFQQAARLRNLQNQENAISRALPPELSESSGEWSITGRKHGRPACRLLSSSSAASRFTQQLLITIMSSALALRAAAFACVTTTLRSCGTSSHKSVSAARRSQFKILATINSTPENAPSFDIVQKGKSLEQAFPFLLRRTMATTRQSSGRS